jgi:hypothetical protein
LFFSSGSLKVAATGVEINSGNAKTIVAGDDAFPSLQLFT